MNITAVDVKFKLNTLILLNILKYRAAPEWKRLKKITRTEPRKRSIYVDERI